MPHYNHFVALCYVRVEVIHRIKFQRSDKKLGIIKVLPFQFSQQHGAFFL